jgi:hypothetical protein
VTQTNLASGMSFEHNASEPDKMDKWNGNGNGNGNGTGTVLAVEDSPSTIMFSSHQDPTLEQLKAINQCIAKVSHPCTQAHACMRACVCVCACMCIQGCMHA